MTSTSIIPSVELQTTHFNPQESTKAPPVLLVHGLLGNKRNFSTIGASLAAQLSCKRHVVAVDLRNHGANIHDVREEMSVSSGGNHEPD